MRLTYTFIVFTILLTTACKTAKPVASTIDTPSVAIASNSNSYIIAVILKATRGKGEDTTIHFELSSAKKRSGKLKEGQNDNSGNDYTVSFANDQKKVVKSYHIKNPLDTWVESTDETGKLQTAPLKKNEDFIPIRTNYTPDLKYIIIQKTKPANADKIIIPLNID